MGARHLLLLAGALLAAVTGEIRAEPAETPFFAPVAGGSRQACSGCHGMDGAGNREGARSMPAIQWSALSRPTPRRPAYDAASFARALATGRDPAGRPLSMLMPRYDLAPTSVEALVAFLTRLGDPGSQGVFPDRLVFATILPEAERRGAHHERAARLIRALFEEANAAGGIYGRRLELVAFSGGADFAARIGSEPVLAVLLSFANERTGRAARILSAEGIPDLFPVHPVTAGDDERRVRGSSAGENDVATALVQEIIGPLGSRSVAVLGGEASPARRSAEAASRGRASAPKPGGAAVLMLDLSTAPPCDGSRLIVAGSVDVLAGLDPERAKTCNWRLVFGDPRFQPDPAGQNAVRLRRLVGGAEVLDTDRAAFVAAELAIRAATAAGRSVNRRRLVEALERLGPVETGLWPALDFRRNPLTGTRTVRVGDAFGEIEADVDAARPPSALSPDERTGPP